MPYRQLTLLLDSRFDALSPELQRAARWVREHPAELGLQSMRRSAQVAGVAPATMSRLARALGLADFESMQRPVKVAFSGGGGRTDLQNDATDDATTRLTKLQAANVVSVAARNLPPALQTAAQRILRARSVVFLGLRASFGIAYHLQYTCDWLRPGTALASDPGGAWADRLNGLGPEDLLVAVSQSPYTSQTVQAVQQVARQGAPVLALTDNALSPLARLATQSLLFEAASPAFFHSMTGALALAEALIDAVAEQGGEAVVARLDARQRQLQAAQIYWDKPRRASATLPPAP